MNSRHIYILIMSLPIMMWAHGGGLDSNGGHTDKKTGTYHYHRSSQPSTPPPAYTPPPSPPVASQPTQRASALPQVPQPSKSPSLTQQTAGSSAIIQYLTELSATQADEIKKLTEKVKELDERLRAIEERGAPLAPK